MRLGKRTTHLLEIVKRTYKVYFRSDAPFAAAAISYYGFLSFIPFMLLLISIAGYVSYYAPALGIDVSRALKFLFEQYGDEIARFVNRIINNRAGYGIIGLIGMFFAFSFVITPIDWALKHVFGTGRMRSFLYQRIVSFIVFFVVLSFGFLVTTFSTLTQAVIIAYFRFRFINLLEEYVNIDIISLLLSISSIVFFAIITYVLLRVLPAERPGKLSAFYGAILSGVLIESGRQLFLLYLRVFPFYDFIYGTLSFLIALFVFIYLTSSLFLVGASFAKALEEIKESK